MSTREQQGVPDGIVLVGHGSSVEESNELVRRVGRRLESRIGKPVQVGFIEKSDPDVQSGVKSLIENCQSITILPLLLFAATHIKQDIPEAIQQIKRDNPNITIKRGKHLGSHPKMVEIVRQRVEDARSELLSEQDSSETTVIFCPKGTSDKDANKTAKEISKQLQQKIDWGQVKPAFLTMGSPSLESVLDTTTTDETRSTIVVPYTVGDGIIANRIRSKAREFRKGNDTCRVITTDVVGARIDDQLIDVLVDRAKRYDEES
ncbi:sirohydrochlorin chelatase [Salinarchaeum sp. IM2453]|uniref:sirohydrochlorin chelatase n=1 Tax=Salinarchaeum sp. IM2453 TaxID=2862870 RepID=UPI001C830D52|nr:sirohydrochlorin chelatase [Salinarchaeum sp. IM2453]QZA89572.1 sirohydrochlorin chelatase [Salinarchaeum sp. IM2453]